MSTKLHPLAAKLHTLLDNAVAEIAARLSVTGLICAACLIAASVACITHHRFLTILAALFGILAHSAARRSAANRRPRARSEFPAER